MTLRLHNIKPPAGSRRSRRRVGRGLSKGGSYSGRGVKGQRARSGGRAGLRLKGMRRLMLAIPKQRGFKSGRSRPSVVSVGALSRAFADGVVVTPAALLVKGLVSDISAGVKVLGDGEIGVKITLKGCRTSESAKAKIEKAGGVCSQSDS